MVMDIEILNKLSKTAGIAGVGFGVFLLIFRDVIRKNSFPILKKDHAYSLLRLVVILTWSVAVLGIIGWLLSGNVPKPNPDNKKFNPVSSKTSVTEEYKFRTMLDDCKSFNYRRCDEVGKALQTIVNSCEIRLKQFKGTGKEFILQKILCGNIQTMNIEFHGVLSAAKSGCTSDGLMACEANTNLLNTIQSFENSQGEMNIYSIVKSYGNL